MHMIGLKNRRSMQDGDRRFLGTSYNTLVLSSAADYHFMVSLSCVFRGSPSVQGNSVFALAGLARAVSLFVQQQNSSGETSQGQRITDWLTMVTDTIMVVLDGNYKPKGPTLIWCQQVNNLFIA